MGFCSVMGLKHCWFRFDNRRSNLAICIYFGQKMRRAAIRDFQGLLDFCPYNGLLMKKVLLHFNINFI